MMVGARTAAWSGNALPYLRRVAYLESHGTEYVSTGISFSDTKVFSCRYSFNRIDISAQVVLGCLGANANFEFLLSN